MNFWNVLKKIINKSDYNIGLIRFGDNIVIPGREYFKDQDKLDLLEEYKKHYILELSKRKVITTLNFNSNKLKQDMSMNVDLILRALLDNDDFYLLASEELIIQSLKLKMYYEEITALEEETILRLIALKEIEKNKRVPRYNRMALEEEINQLNTILEMFSYRKSAVNIELKNYFDVISIKNLEKLDTDIFKQRLDKLLFITDGIIDKKELDKYEDIKLKIAILERECEKYTYLNKNEVKELRQYKRYYFNYQSYDSITFEMIEKLEKKYLLFNEHCNEYISYEELEEIYLVKYYVILNLIFHTDQVYDFSTDYGYHYYKNFLENKIESILKGKCYDFNEDFKFDISRGIQLFKEYLFENDGLDLDSIFNDKNKLVFINTYICYFINITQKFYNYLKSVKLKDFKELYKEKGVVFDDNASMINVMDFVSENNPIYNFPLYKMFLLKYENDIDFKLLFLGKDKNNFSNDYVYFLPNNLISLDLILVNDNLFKKISNNCNNKVLYCPYSLKHLTYGRLFDESNIFKIVLNDGLETFRCNYYQYVSSLYYPYFRNAKSKLMNKNTVIQINNYIFSKLLRDRTEVKNLFSYYSLYSNVQYGEDVTPEHLFKFAKLMLNYDDINLDCELTYEELLSQPFSMIYVKDDYDTISNYAVEHLRQKIKEKTGHDIFKSNAKIKRLSN